MIELDMFNPAIESYAQGPCLAGFGTDLDSLVIDEFLAAIDESREPKMTGQDGLNAARVAFAGYESIEAGAPVTN